MVKGMGQRAIMGLGFQALLAMRTVTMIGRRLHHSTGTTALVAKRKTKQLRLAQEQQAQKGDSASFDGPIHRG